MIQESVEALQEDRTNKDEILWFRKKIENLSNLVNILKSNDDSKNNSNHNIKNEINKYLDIQTFIDFKNSIISELNSTNKRGDELGRLIDDAFDILETKANIKDLKNLDENLKLRFEEYKNYSIKRFSDKQETNNKYRYLDGEIKAILDKEKNKEKGDNWLLAKKPVNGYSCASCEAYLGDLHDTSQPVHWNKYPNRDFNNDPNKLYRVIISIIITFIIFF